MPRNEPVGNQAGYGFFQIDVETCPSCGGRVQIIASIEDPPVIERILSHLATEGLPGLWAESRAPPAK